MGRIEIMSKTKLVEYLNSLEERGIPGCDCVVYHNHKPVFRHMAGFSDPEKTRPITVDNTYWLYSVSKLITCTAVMQLVDRAVISLDDPVYEYLPEYKNLKVKSGTDIKKAENTMTIRHLLTMQSGLNYNIYAPSIQEILKDTNGQATTRQIVGALANEPLDFEPGTHFQYSLSHDVLGAVIEVASGQQFGTYLDDNIFKPLGMKNTGFVLTEERKAKMAAQYAYNEEINGPAPISFENGFTFSPKYESGGGGLISTVDDCILYLDAMCNGDLSSGGYRLLSMEAIDLMRTDQLQGESRRDFRMFGKIGYSYGLGVRTLVDKVKSRARSPLGEFGWDGAAGSYAMIDVENHLAVFYAQHVLGCGYVYSEIHPKIRDLTYDMLKI
jgi:CubicO group peptidase (beta-lactamase class C family)